ncbi:DUF3072 domain-containing protein [Kineococcus sp. SYSU DK003]|uniref:DUF3072 domain-containing protein n=1 Tax=Kineococcus sp. SYSU DK003 TaxID=3383124 RepID=UPI003D7D1C32
MSEQQTPEQPSDPTQSAEKDPETWVTGDEPMTGPQRSYLQTLAREAGRDLPDDLDKARASELIDELQKETGRGAS